MTDQLTKVERLCKKLAVAIAEQEFKVNQGIYEEIENKEGAKVPEVDYMKSAVESTEWFVHDNIPPLLYKRTLKKYLKLVKKEYS